MKTIGNDRCSLRCLFWIIFLFVAIQILMALLINFSRNTNLFYLQAIISIFFCTITIRTALALINSVFHKTVAVCLIILAYVLATGFFFITAIFIGGLPG